MAPLKNNEKNSPLMTFINRFKGSYGTFGKKKIVVVNDTRLVCPKKKKKTMGWMLT
jgi:hypothetical protein